MFHETLSQAVQAGIDSLKESGASFIEQNIWDRFTFDGLKYGENKEAHTELESLKNKKTSKWGHVTVWRHETGRYEVNSYIL